MDDHSQQKSCLISYCALTKKNILGMERAEENLLLLLLRCVTMYVLMLFF